MNSYSFHKGEILVSKIDYIQPNKEEWLNKFMFETKVKVRFSETDAFGHVNNVSHIIYFEQARLDYLQEIDVLSYFMDPKCPSIIVTADIHCHYLGQIYFGEQLAIRVRTAKLGHSSIDVQYAIVQESNQKVLATGRGAVVHVDKKTGKSIPWSDKLRNQIIKYELNEVLQ
jgi:acyl-CoA thioester hydrolase